MYQVRVLVEYCKGCGLCVEACPVEALELSEQLSALAVYPPRPGPPRWTLMMTAGSSLPAR